MGNSNMLKIFFVLAVLTAIFIVPNVSAELIGTVTYRNCYVIPFDIGNDLAGTGVCSAEGTLQNTGSSAVSGIVELGIYRSSLTPMFPLLTIGIEQKSCTGDLSRHRIFTINAGATETFALQSRGIPIGSWNPVITTVTGCCNTGNCEALGNFGWGRSLFANPFVVQQPSQPIQCNFDSACDGVLKLKGVYNCAKPDCLNENTAQSQCVCAQVGQCSSGVVETVNCANGRIVDTRRCVNAQWVSTGESCPATPPPPPPPFNKGLLWLVAGIGILLLYGIFLRRK